MQNQHRAENSTEEEPALVGAMTQQACRWGFPVPNPLTTITFRNHKRLAEKSQKIKYWQIFSLGQ